MDDEFVVAPPQLPPVDVDDVDDVDDSLPDPMDTATELAATERTGTDTTPSQLDDAFEDETVTAMNIEAALEEAASPAEAAIIGANPAQDPPAVVVNGDGEPSASGANEAESTKRNRESEESPVNAVTSNKRQHTDNTNKRSTSTGRPSTRDAKAPKPPRIAFELYALKYKRTVAASKKNKGNQNHHHPNNNNNKTTNDALPQSQQQPPPPPTTKGGSTNKNSSKNSAVPTIAKIRTSYDKLGFREKQQWKIQQAEDLVRYETQLATYAALTENTAEANGEAAGSSEPILADTTKDFAVPFSVATIETKGGKSGGETTTTTTMIPVSSLQENHSYYDRAAPSSLLGGRNTSGHHHSSFASSGVASHSKLSLARSSFNDFVFELLSYKADKGHCRVPVKKGGVLGKWVDKIRKEYKKLKATKRSFSESSSTNNDGSYNNNDDDTKPPSNQGNQGQVNQAAVNAANRAIGTMDVIPESLGGAATDVTGASEPIDIPIGDHGVYFANAYGRNDNEIGEGEDNTNTTSGDNKDAEVVADNVRLDCYSPSDLLEQSSSSLPPPSKTTNRFERIKILSFLGMVWEFPNEDYEEIWQKHFRDLLDYKTRHGNCNVPQKGYGRLSWWVKIQRELYVNTKGPKKDNLKKTSRPRQLMPQHRIDQLESVGFEWRIRPPALKWEERYKELIRYKREVGDCNVPQNYPPNRVLGKWVMKQRGYYYDKVRGKKSPLNPHRQSKLEAIGFCWVAPHVAKTKAKLPLREDIIKEQLRARDVVATVVAAAAASEVDNHRNTLRNNIGQPQNPPVAVVIHNGRSEEHPQPLQQQQQHHHPHHDVYPYHYQQQQPQHHDVTGAISYFAGPTATIGNHQHDPQHPEQQHQHVGGLGVLEGSILNHISPSEHYLARPLEHDHLQLQQQQQQTYHHQQQHHIALQQQQQHLNHDGQEQHGHHAPQEQQQQLSPPPPPMMFLPQQPLPQGTDVVGPPGASVLVAAPVYPQYIGGPGGLVGAGNDATTTTNPHQQQEQQQQQPPTQQEQGGINIAPDEPYFAL
jgi:hypothetical protein